MPLKEGLEVRIGKKERKKDHEKMKTFILPLGFPVVSILSDTLTIKAFTL